MMHRFTCCLWILLILSAASRLPAVLPMREQWKTACQALASGNPVAADGLLEEFEKWYGNEPQAREPAFREGWLRIRGLAALQSGRLAAGLEHLETWLEENPLDRPYHAFLRFQAAEAREALEEMSAAAEHREAFRRDFPRLPERILATWKLAEYHLGSARPEVASTLFGEILEAPELPDSGKDLARAALALIALSDGSPALALDRLAAGPNGAGAVLDLWRGLLAPALVDTFLQADQPDRARLAGEWLQPASRLRQELLALRGTTGRPGTGAGGQPVSVREAIWRQHWEQQLERLEKSLTVADPQSSETAQLYALRLQTLLENGLAREAALLGRALRESVKSGQRELQAVAFRESIRAAQALRDWATAASLAGTFLERFPGDPAVPGILLLNARTAAQRGDYRMALLQSARLVDAFPDHPSRNAWELERGEWMRADGRAGEARMHFQTLEDKVPAQWLPFLRFQQARCHEALGERETAIEAYRAVGDMEWVTAELRESASVAVLKMLLRSGQWPAFQDTLARYHIAFPDGRRRLLVDNLEAAFLWSMGKRETAVERYRPVAATSGPEGGEARAALSRCFRQMKDHKALVQHAREWISRALREGWPLSTRPFEDGCLVQEAEGKPALDPVLAQSLLEAVDQGDPRVPASAFLAVLAGAWQSTGASLAGPRLVMNDWLQQQADRAWAEGRQAAFAGYQLFLADQLEKAGRPDSADARRIGVFRKVEPEVLGAASAFVVAKTADRYAFPEAPRRLAVFLEQFPESPDVPEALYRLARWTRREGDPAEARNLLAGLFRDWPDAEIHAGAGLLLAAWQLEDRLAEAAHATASAVLELPGLPPQTCAQALLIRAESDFRMGHAERARLACLRVQNLFPDLGDFQDRATSLLARYETADPASPV